VKTPKWLNQIAAQLNNPEGKAIVTKLKIGVVNAIGVFVTEILFVMVPVIVLAMIHLYKGAGQNIWSIPEWSFIAAVLFGQAIPRMFYVLDEAGRPFNPKTTSAVAAIVIVLGLIPSLLILIFLALSDNPSRWLIFGQLIMFILSILTLLIFTLIQHVAPEVGKILEAICPDYVEPAPKVQPSLPAEKEK